MAQAVDFQYWHPDAPTLLAEGITGALTYQYVKDVAAYLAELNAGGITTAGIYEWQKGDVFSGETGGKAAAQKADAAFTPGTLVYYAVDTNPVDDAVVADYFRGIADGTREPVIGVYGARAVIDAARDASGKVQRFWGVETWIEKSWGPDNLARWQSYGAHIMQWANKASPWGSNADLVEVLQPNWASIGDGEEDMTPEEHADLKFCAQVAQQLHDANFWGPAGDSGRLGLADGFVAQIRQVVAEEVAKLTVGAAAGTITLQGTLSPGA